MRAAVLPALVTGGQGGKNALFSEFFLKYLDQRIAQSTLLQSKYQNDSIDFKPLLQRNSDMAAATEGHGH